MVLHKLHHPSLSMMERHMSPFDLQRYAGRSPLGSAKVYAYDDMESAVNATVIQ